MLTLAYLWLEKVPRDPVRIITGHSPNTVTNFFACLRQLVSDSLEFEEMLIDGEGVNVEIEEAKFGKRKYNLGHRVEGAWNLVVSNALLNESCSLLKSLPHCSNSSRADHDICPPWLYNPH
jgi:hypothetical protein